MATPLGSSIQRPPWHCGFYFVEATPLGRLSSCTGPAGARTRGRSEQVSTRRCSVSRDLVPGSQICGFSRSRERKARQDIVCLFFR